MNPEAMAALVERIEKLELSLLSHAVHIEQLQADVAKLSEKVNTK